MFRKAFFILILGVLFFSPVNFVLAVSVTSTGTTTVRGSYTAPDGCNGCGNGDTTAPAAVTNLTVTSFTDSTVTLTWTAPGNDANTGTAAQYSLRYSTTGPLTQNNWDLATVAANPPTPQIAGSTETFTVRGLNPATTYYFALKTADGVPNWSSISNSPQATTSALGDHTQPEISNVDVENITGASAKVIWTTNEAASSTVVFGVSTGNYNLPKVSSNNLVTSHSLTLNNLTPNTTYFFLVKSADASFNEAVSSEHSFTTLDTVPPVISNIVATPFVTSANITWKTNKNADSQVAYGTSNQLGKLSTKNEEVTDHTISLTNLLPNTKYYFVVRSAGPDTEHSSSEIGEFTTARDSNPPANVHNLQATAGNAVVDLSWSKPVDTDLVGVVIRWSTHGFPQTPTDGTEIYKGAATSFHHPGLSNSVVQYYSVFAYDTSINYASGALVSATPYSDGTPPEGPGQPPGGGEDNIFLISDFNFSVAKGKINVSSSNKMATLGNTGFLISLDKSKIKRSIESFVLNFSNSFYLFSFNETAQKWKTEITSPVAPGVYQADIIVTFQDKSSSKTSWQLEVLPWGQIYEKKNGLKQPVSQVTVSLLTSPTLWPAEAYGEINPQMTDSKGVFGFLVPPGKYILKIEKEGYHIEETGYFDSIGVVINKNIEILLKPPTLEEVINPQASLTENALAVAQNLGKKTVFAAKILQKKIVASSQTIVKEVAQFVSNPIMKETTNQVVAPTVAAAAVAGATASIGFSQFLLYLRFLFTQPFLLIHRRRRRGWGVVYNSLTKMPLDLVIVRLVDVVSNRVVQSRVTDKEGRYAFLPVPGRYRLEINQPNFKYPSTFLSAFKEDGTFLDLYHSEVIEVREKGAVITPNVPLDPIGVEIPVGKILWRATLRRLQHALSIVTLILSVAFLIITPSVLTWILFGVQIVFYLLFLRLAYPRQPKSWGIVYDEHNRRPLHDAIVRIFDTQYNKLLETQITDHKGRYSFLVGRNTYYVMSEKRGYEKKKSDPIDLTQHPEPSASLGVDMGLKRQENISLPKTPISSNSSNSASVSEPSLENPQ